MKSAQAFDGDDLSVFDGLRRRPQRRVMPDQNRAAGIPKLELRSARGAGVRLGVKAPVERIFVFGAAILAHLENFHGRVRAVIRQRFDDRKTRSAIRAVCKWISVAAVEGIEDFPKAIAAGRNIGQHDRRFCAVLAARANFETGKPDGIEKRAFQTLDKSARRCFLDEFPQKGFELFPRPFDLDKDALRRVIDPAPKGKPVGETINERAKADALHRAAHGHAKTLDFFFFN